MRNLLIIPMVLVAALLAAGPVSAAAPQIHAAAGMVAPPTRQVVWELMVPGQISAADQIRVTVDEPSAGLATEPVQVLSERYLASARMTQVMFWLPAGAISGFIVVLGPSGWARWYAPIGN